MRNTQFKSLPMTEEVPLTSQLITSDPLVPAQKKYRPEPTGS
jgi:hypothetical protein